MQRISLIGNIGKDPEERVTSNGAKVVSFPLGVSPRKDETNWFDIVLWGSAIERFSKLIPYLSKGSRIYVIGAFKTPTPYQKKDGSIGLNLQVHPDAFNILNTPVVKKEEIQPMNYGRTSPESMPNEDDIPF